MNILMFTNTFTPHVGGVARSVQQFTKAFQAKGNRVLVVAPEFPDVDANEEGVVRIPALQSFNGTDFSVAVPIPGYLNATIREFEPEIVHSHHPFVLGDTALRFSAKYEIPMVFTHHTQYEQYTHYVPGDSEVMKRFAINLSVGYCNLCDAVVSPSETIRQRLLAQGVTSEIVEIPTGVPTNIFGNGVGKRARKKLGIPVDRFVVGHVGRLAPEKGLDFLANVVSQFVESHPNACFLVAGGGPSSETIEKAFHERGISDRLVMVGKLDRPELADVYAAMDVFVFASQSETQGMVLTEAMAAGTPVIAVDAPGVREVLRTNINGVSLPGEDTSSFIAAMDSFSQLAAAERESLEVGARKTAAEFSIEATADKALALYERLIASDAKREHHDDTWSVARRRIGEEWKIWSNAAEALVTAVRG